MHDAELNSAISSIWILPPGQVRYSRQKSLNRSGASSV